MVRKKRWLDPGRLPQPDRPHADAALHPALPVGRAAPPPEIDGMVRYAADRGVRSMLTTNGTLLDEPMAARLLASGLDAPHRSRSTATTRPTSASARSRSPRSASDARAAALRDRGGHALRIDVSMVLDDTTKPAIDRLSRQLDGHRRPRQVIPRLARTRRERAAAKPGAAASSCWSTARSPRAAPTAKASSRSATPIATRRRDPERRALPRLRARPSLRPFPEPCKGCGEFDGRDVGVSSRFSMARPSSRRAQEARRRDGSACRRPR
jgi:hypothetical protein